MVEAEAAEEAEGAARKDFPFKAERNGRRGRRRDKKKRKEERRTGREGAGGSRGEKREKNRKMSSFRLKHRGGATDGGRMEAL